MIIIAENNLYISNNSISTDIYNKLHEKFPAFIENIHFMVVQASAIIESYKKSHIYMIFSCIIVVLLLASHTHYYLHSYSGKEDNYLGDASKSEKSIYSTIKNLLKPNNKDEPVVISILYWILSAILTILAYTFGIIIKLLHIILFNLIHIHSVDWMDPYTTPIIPNNILNIIINILYMLLYPLLLYLLIILIHFVMIPVINSIMKTIINKKIVTDKRLSMILVCCLFPYLLYVCYAIISTIHWSIFFKSETELKTSNMPIAKRCAYIRNDIKNQDVAIVAQILFTIFMDPIIFLLECIWYLASIQLISPNVDEANKTGWKRVIQVINNILSFIIQWSVRVLIIILFGICCIIYINSAKYIQEEHQTDIITLVNFNSKNGINLYKKQQPESKVPITI